MKFLVGSRNQVKIGAAKALRSEFLCLHIAEIEGADVESIVTKQPMSIDEISQGAMHRAAYIVNEADDPDTYGIGIESGLVQVYANGPWLDVAVACIWGGGGIWFGLSWGFTVPSDIMVHIHAGLDLSEAAKAAGYTTKDKLGAEEGIIGILTGGRMPRIEQAKSALRQAFFDFERPLRK